MFFARDRVALRGPACGTFVPSVMLAARRALVALLLAALGTSTSGAATSAVAGSVVRYDAATFKQQGSLSGGEIDDAFGTTVWDRFMATAPGAADGGRVYLVSEAEVGDSITGGDLEGGAVERLGESWDDLGHPPGTNNVLAIGAPGSPDSSRRRRAVEPAVVLVNWNGGRFTREVRRVTGTAGSLFGWRVEAVDPQVPASFHAGFIVSAPLEDRGARKRVGAVYRFDTETGQQVWRFRGEQAGELVGYDMTIAPDADGDGTADLLVGAPGARDADPSGRVYLISSATGAVLDTREAPDGALLFGYTVRSRSAAGPVLGTIVGAPATAKGKKEQVGAIYAFADFDAQPTLFQGKRRDQWFGISLAMTTTHLLVGSFEGHKKAAKDQRGSVTALTATGKQAKLLRGKSGGDFFGRSLFVGAALAVGVPASPPLFVPE